MLDLPLVISIRELIIEYGFKQVSGIELSAGATPTSLDYLTGVTLLRMFYASLANRIHNDVSEDGVKDHRRMRVFSLGDDFEFG